MPGNPGVTVVTNSRVFSTREPAGASSARHSLRPLIWTAMFESRLGHICREIADVRPRTMLFEI